MEVFTLSVEHQSPVFAKTLVEIIIKLVNDDMRARDIFEATESIKYLRNQIQNSSIAELNQVFYEMIQSQTQTVMLASVRQDYVFKVLDPPVVPHKPVAPNRLLIAAFGFFFGALLALIVVISVLFRSAEQQEMLTST